MMRPDVSVVMSVYNGEDTLPMTMDSILAQDGVNLEVVVINDGSTDGSQRILDDYSQTDPRVQVFHQENQGLTRALQDGILRARGDLIARHDVGDRSYPHRLMTQAEYLRTHPHVVAVGCGHRRVGPSGEVLGETMGEMDPERVSRRFLDGGSALLHAATVFRKQAYEQSGGYRPQFLFAQDHDLWYRLSDLGKLSEVSEILCEIEINLTGISAANRFTQTELARLARVAHETRLRGESDESILRQAQRVSDDHRERKKCAAASQTQVRAAAYLIGSQLLANRDARCRGYLIQAALTPRLFSKAIAKYLQSFIVCSPKTSSDQYAK